MSAYGLLIKSPDDDPPVTSLVSFWQRCVRPRKSEETASFESLPSGQHKHVRLTILVRCEAQYSASSQLAQLSYLGVSPPVVVHGLRPELEFGPADQICRPTW